MIMATISMQGEGGDDNKSYNNLDKDYNTDLARATLTFLLPSFLQILSRKIYQNPSM